MVQIPTSRDINRQSTQSGRAAVRAPTSGIGEAAASAGFDLTSVAYNLNQLRVQEQNEMRNKAGYDLQTKITQFRDQEEKTFNAARESSDASGIGFTRQFMEGYETRVNDFIKNNFNGVNDAQDANSRQTLLGLGNSLYGKSYSYETQAKTKFYDRTTNQGLDTVRTQIRSNAAPYEELKRQGLAAIDSADMPETWKAERRALWDSDAAESKWRWKFEQDPQTAISEVKGGGGSVVDKIIGAESGGNATAKNPNSSATGAGQFISSTWMNMVKKYRPDVAEGKSAAEVLALRNDPSLSREMTTRYTQENADYLKNQGIQQTDGNVYLAHFLGPGGAARVLKSDPSASVASVVGEGVVNANPFLKGMSVADVQAWSDKKMGGKGVTSTASRDTSFDAIPYDRREQLASWGEAEYRKKQNEQAAVARFEIDTATANAPAAIMNTGTYTGVMPQQEQFIQAYGADMGARKYNELMAAVQTSTQAFSMQTMPESEIQQMVKQSAPTSSGENAKIQNDQYETLQAAAQQTIKAREADPSTYVQQAFPHVAEAWKNAGVNGDYQGALSVTAAAQQQLGIKNMQLMPKQLATDTVNRFKDSNLPGDERINAITGLVFSSKDQGQRQAVYQQLVSAGLPDTTEGAIEAYARGDQGAGRRLMEAAIIDPGKLPGTAPFKPSEIDAAIQSQIMDEGQLGDIAYGLTNGSVENQERAIKDAKLLTNAVNIRVRNGEALETAVSSAAKDLFGDVQPVTGNGQVNAQIIIPTGENPDKVLNGLESFLPSVRSTLQSSMSASTSADQSEAVRSTGGAKIIDAVTSNYIENVMAEGYFRNAGNGYVFMDPYVGAAISGPDGKPMIFTPDQVAAAPVKAKVDPIAEADNAASMRRVQSQQEVNQSEYGKFSGMLDQATGDQPPEPARSFNPGPINGGR